MGEVLLVPFAMSILHMDRDLIKQQLKYTLEETNYDDQGELYRGCLLYTSPSPRDVEESRMPSSA